MKKDKPFEFQGTIIRNQTELFDYVWDTRPHVSEISGKRLHLKGSFWWHNQFLHVLSKGAYPTMKLDPENIMLALPDEHSKQESFKIFQDRKQELKEKYYQQNQIKKL